MSYEKTDTQRHKSTCAQLYTLVLGFQVTGRQSYQGRGMHIEDMEARLCKCRLYDRNKAMRFKTKFSGEKNRWEIKKVPSCPTSQNSEHFIVFDLPCSAVSTFHLVPKSGRSSRLCLHLLSLLPSSGRLSLHSHFYANNSQIDAFSLDLSQELQSHLSKGQDIGQDIITSSQTQYLFKKKKQKKGKKEIRKEKWKKEKKRKPFLSLQHKNLSSSCFPYIWLW